MLLNRKVFALEPAASKDPKRTALECIRIFEDGSAVATDGALLFKFKPTEHLNPKEYPHIEGVKSGNGAKLKPFSLSTSAARAVLKTVPKSRKGMLPILRHVLLDVDETNASQHAVLAFTDLKRPTVIRPQKVAEDFPDYEKVMPKGKAQFKVGFKLDTLWRALKVLDNLDVEWFSMTFRSPAEPVEIRGKCFEKDGSVLGLVMPARVSDDDAADDLRSEATDPEAEAAAPSPAKGGKGKNGKKKKK
jgi:hypothetical protein